MPSLRKDSRGRSPFWICCYTSAAGQRLQKSTKIRIKPVKGEKHKDGSAKTAADKRSEALEVCLAIERAENYAKNGTLTEHQAKKIIGEILERTTGEPLRNYRVRDWFTHWLDMKEQVRSGKTMDRYRQVIRDFIASLGSEFAAFDDSKPFIPREADLLRAATKADVPVLGLCFGGQLLARTLGGKSFRSDRSEIGWLPIRTEDPELVSEGPWFNWHFDSFTLPPGATLIAETDVGPQAYVVGRSLGLQFHPEVTPEIMESWVKAYRHELDGDGVDPDALLEQTHRLAPEVRRRSERLFNRFVTAIARVTPEGARGR